ncbi:hypothetical protein BO443_30557 [Burkholderia orbicola]
MTLVSAADTYDAHRDRIAAIATVATVIAPPKPSVPVPAFPVSRSARFRGPSPCPG